MKYFIIPLGQETYMLPTDFVTKDMAKYYFEKGEYKTMEEAIKSEGANLDGVKDWLLNNMDFFDFENELILKEVEEDPQTKEEHWNNIDYDKIKIGEDDE